MRYRLPRPGSPRRGVTLVEMLVAVTLLVLMMTMIVTIFASATGAVSGLQVFQQLDGDLRQLDTTIRRDLTGTTARMVPPLNPNEGRGYFEIGENTHADLQGEDTDDYMRFTTKAPEGQLFTGRAWLGEAADSPNQPVMISSQYAEIIYFLRNGNLYRRVLLVVPERQDAINTAWTKAGGVVGTPVLFQPSIFGGASVGWQSVNDISARPATSGSASGNLFPIVLNTLADLTNRENRAFYPRFANDYFNVITSTAGPDGIPDDINPDTINSVPNVGDSVPDYYPTLYPGMPTTLMWEPTTAPRPAANNETLAFPFIYPGAYSRPDANLGALTGYGWIHSTDPNPTTPFANLLDQLQKINHSPIETGGDSLPLPDPDPTRGQTWWGFPTWRETLLPGWTDPNIPVLTAGIQPDGLHPFYADDTPAGGANAAIMATNFLPPMNTAHRATAQPFTDGLGNAVAAASSALWQGSWDDDLIMTNVRSFDIKVFDNAFPGYVDLGWGDDLRLQPMTAPGGAPADYLCQANGALFQTRTPAVTYWTSGNWDTLTQTFAHEGRMPPLVTDLRQDAQFPNPFYPTPQYPTAPYNVYTGNVGDANAKVMRLRRVWDTWSTDYSHAPATGFHPTTKLPVGPPFSPPIYPSYPAPYPVPMRGIQIQIRVTDPRNEKVKTLTIRQDFSDKL